MISRFACIGTVLSLFTVSLYAGGANLAKNSSFEAGLDGYEVVRTALVKDDNKVVYIDPVLDATEKYHGDCSLRLDNPNGDGIKVYIKEVKLTPGKKYTVSMWLKASQPGMNLYIDLRGMEGGRPYNGGGRTCHLKTGWERYSFTHTVPEGYSYYYTELHINSGHGGAICPVLGTVWVDGLQIEAGDMTAYAPAPLELGASRTLSRAYTLSSGEAFPAQFKVRNNGAATASAKIVYKVVDEYFNKTVKSGEIPVVAGPGSTVEKKLDNISPLKRGKFILRAELVDANGAAQDASTLEFAVIDSVKTSTFTNGFTVCGQGFPRSIAFGVDFKDRQLMTLYSSNLDSWYDFNAEAGDRWIRDWGGAGCDVFVWRLIEPQEGQYDWSMPDRFVNEAVKHGVRVMPVMGDWWWINDSPKGWQGIFFPEWAIKKYKFSAGTNPGEASKGWLMCTTPPEELVEWQRFVKACVNRYKGRITHWEILNEPNVSISPEYYTAYLKMMHRVIKEADPDAKVVGFCATGDLGGNAGKFLSDCFKLGAMDYCDVISFHPYGSPLDWSTPTSAETMNSQVRKIVDQNGGEKKEIWCTELYYVGKPTSNDFFYQHEIKGHELARRFLIDLASGIGKSFTVPHDYYKKVTLAPHYLTGADGLSADLIPRTYFVIYNTLAKYFSGSKFSKQVPLAGRNKLYVFEREGSPIAAAWNFDETEKTFILRIPGGKGKVACLDIMGNALEGVETKGDDLVMDLSNSPIYFAPSGATTPAEFQALMGNVTTRGKIPVDLAALVSFQGNDLVLLIEGKNVTPDAISTFISAKVPGKEFSVPANGKSLSLPPNEGNVIRLPITATTPWEQAKINLQMMVGEQIFQKEVTVTPRLLTTCAPLKIPVAADGVVKPEEWKDAASFTVSGKDRIKDGNPEKWKDPANCSAVVYLKYDAANLYVAARVEDDSVPERRQREASSDGNAMELFLDAKPDSDIGVETFIPSTYQVVYGMPTAKYPEPIFTRNAPSGKGMDLKEIKTASSVRPGGYDIEMVIPWKELDGFQPHAGDILGFDVAFDHGEKGLEGRLFQMIWSGDKKNYRSRAHFGRMLLN